MRRVVSAAAAISLLVSGCALAGGSGDHPSSHTSSDGASPLAPSSHDSGHSTAGAPPSPGALGLDERFVEVGIADDLPGGVYVPEAPGGGTDDYRCFLADPGITADSFVTGVQFLPSNPAVVHHAIVFRVDRDQVDAAEAKDADDPRPGWECFGGPGIRASGSTATSALDSAPWLAAWAPGGRESRFADDVGVPLDAASRVVVQMHYNLRAAQGAAAQDSTHVRLRVSTRPDLTPLRTMLLPAPVELPCARGQSGPLCDRDAAVADVVDRFGEDSRRLVAGLQLICDGDFLRPAPGVTQDCVRPVTTATTVRAAAGHMHLLGSSIEIVANEGTPRETTLLDVPVWDFDDQSARTLDEPVALKPGDTVTVRCSHDATLRDKIPSLQDLPDRYVVWGEGTTDEMCLGILLVT